MTSSATNSLSSPLLYSSVSDVMYSYALSSAYRRQYVYDPSYALARTPDIWEIVRSDVGFSASIDRYTNQVTKPWHVEAAKKSKDEGDQQYAEIVSDAIDCIFDFDNARRILSEAAFLGRRYAKIVPERKMISLGGEAEMEWIVPVELKDIDRRRFRWVPIRDTAGKLVDTKLHMFDLDTSMWREVHPEFRKALIEFIWYNTEDRVGNGRGWLEPIYFAHYMKTNTIKDVADGVNRWTKGIWLVKLDALRNASTDKTNDDMVTAGLNMARTMRSQHVGVIENTDDIQVIETSGSGHQMAMDFVHYWDDAVERLVNGSTRPTGLGGSKTGARAQAETEEDSSEAHYQPARDTGDAVINRDLVGWFISQPLNRQNLEKLGLGKAKRPIFHSRQEKKEAIADIIASATLFMQNGLPLVEQQVYERAGGWSVPGPDDKTVSGKALMGPTDMVGDFGNADEINQNASQNVAADRKAKQKPKPAKMQDDDIAARFDELKEEIAKSREGGTHVHLADGMKLNIPEPKVTVNVPEQKVIIQPQERVVIPAPVVENKIEVKPAPVNLPQLTATFQADPKAGSALEKIASLLGGVLQVFSLSKGKKTTTIKERDSQGNISKFETTEE